MKHQAETASVLVINDGIDKYERGFLAPYPP